MTIPEFNPQTDIRFRDLRKLGWPFPKEIPDDAWVPMRAIKTKGTPRDAKSKTQQVLIYFSEPIRCGTKVYRIVDNKVIEEDARPIQNRQPASGTGGGHVREGAQRTG